LSAGYVQGDESGHACNPASTISIHSLWLHCFERVGLGALHHPAIDARPVPIPYSDVSRYVCGTRRVQLWCWQWQCIVGSGNRARASFRKGGGSWYGLPLPWLGIGGGRALRRLLIRGAACFLRVHPMKVMFSIVNWRLRSIEGTYKHELCINYSHILGGHPCRTCKLLRKTSNHHHTAIIADAM
jgi:hypothetical protein